jgi:hypothetical protein
MIRRAEKYLQFLPNNTFRKASAAHNFSAKGVAMRDVLFQNTRATVYDKPTEASQFNQSKRLECSSAYKE